MSKINPTDPAMPMKDVPFEVQSPQKGNVMFNNDGKYDFRVDMAGFTIRQEIAIRILASMAHGTYAFGNEEGRRSYAKEALAMADTFIQVYNEQEGQQ